MRRVIIQPRINIISFEFRVESFELKDFNPKPETSSGQIVTMKIKIGNEKECWIS
jgi:hypothetical protein